MKNHRIRNIIVVAAVEANNGGPFFQNLVIIDGFYEEAEEGNGGQEGLNVCTLYFSTREIHSIMARIPAR